MLLAKHVGPFREGCLEAIPDGVKIDPLKPDEVEWPDGQVFLQIEAD